MPHSGPKRRENVRRNHAGPDGRSRRKPAWLTTLGVDRRRVSRPSARLTMQKVEGSSPFIRLGTEPNQASLAFQLVPLKCHKRARSSMLRAVRLASGLSAECEGLQPPPAGEVARRRGVHLPSDRSEHSPTKLTCSECGEEFYGRKDRLTCSGRCKDARYRRLHPDTYRQNRSDTEAPEGQVVLAKKGRRECSVFCLFESHGAPPNRAQVHASCTPREKLCRA